MNLFVELLFKLVSFIVPHQPRLDWQMWFAALATYEQNPWFVSFIYRLLEGQKDGTYNFMHLNMFWLESALAFSKEWLFWEKVKNQMS